MPRVTTILIPNKEYCKLYNDISEVYNAMHESINKDKLGDVLVRLANHHTEELHNNEQTKTKKTAESIVDNKFSHQQRVKQSSSRQSRQSRHIRHKGLTLTTNTNLPMYHSILRSMRNS